MERYATDLHAPRESAHVPWVAWLMLGAGVLLHHSLASQCWQETHVDSSRPIAPSSINAGNGIAIDLSLNAGQLELPAIRNDGRFLHLLGMVRELPPSELAIVVAMMTPFLVALSTYLASIKLWPAALATWLSIGLWWITPNAEQWTNGYFETVSLGPVAGFYFAGLIRFHRLPGVFGWLAITASSMLGWALFPVPWLLFFFPATIAWLIVAHRHGWLWHGWLILALVVAAAPFAPQWFEMMRHWPMIVEQGAELFDSAWPKFHGDRTTVAAVAVTQTGLLLLPCVARARHCISALLMVGLVTSLIVIGLTQPSAKSIGDAVRQTWTRPASQNETEPQPVDSRSFHAGGTARLLIETAGDRSLCPELSQLRSQTPMLCGTPGRDDMLPWNLANGRLAGRNFAEISDEELRRLVERWNIGFIWATTPATIERLAKWSIAKQPMDLAGGQLFQLDRNARYVLKGHAIWSPQTNGDILLTDVVPEQGEVVLSLRYYRNWAVGPGHIIIEPEIDPYDVLPIVRLKLNGPVSRIQLRLAR